MIGICATQFVGHQKSWCWDVFETTQP
jgi:hypothetical protein